MVQNHQKSSCWGDDPTIRNTRNLHPGTTSRIKKHELAAPWSMRVFLHCAFLWRQCQLLVQLSNVSDSKQAKTNPSPLNRETGKTLKNLKLPWMNPISGASKSGSYTTFVILCQSIVTGPALAALAAWKFRMLLMPWQNDTDLQAGKQRGKVEGLGFTSQLQQILPFRYQNVSHESRTNSTRLMFTRAGTPDGVPWARCPWPSFGHVSALPGVAEFSWFQLRVLWAFKTSCAAIEMTPQKREHMQPWVFEAYSLYFFLLIRMMRHIFE